MAQDTTAAATSSGLLPPKDEPAPTRTASAVSPALQATLYYAPVQAYLAANPTVTNPLASAAVFYHHPGNKKSKPPPPRLLLLQRAQTDTLPLKWELPGGSVDLPGSSGEAGGAGGGDASLVHGAVRELREETGLVARGVVRELGVQREFYEDVTVGGGQRVLTWRMVVFEVDVDFDGKEEAEGGPKVRLAPGEHVRYLWCTEEDVRAGWCEGVELELTDEEWRGIMLRAFELHREGRDEVVLE